MYHIYCIVYILYMIHDTFIPRWVGPGQNLEQCLTLNCPGVPTPQLIYFSESLIRSFRGRGQVERTHSKLGRW